jgi:hypothetical protein
MISGAIVNAARDHDVIPIVNDGFPVDWIRQLRSRALNQIISVVLFQARASLS